MEKKFEPGRILLTKTISEQTEKDAQLAGFVFACLRRHQSGDWGDLPQEDADINEQALQNGEKLFSAYHYKDNSEIWIITEEDRCATIILRPEDY